MDKAVLQDFLTETIVSIETISGGDIAHAQKVNTNTETFFVKSASFKNAQQLFEQESLGLEKIAATKTINTPKIMGSFNDKQTACLILEFITSKSPDAKDYETFGRKLAQLHNSGNGQYFGFEADNFIGKLPQANPPNKDWGTFYVQYRLQAQLKMAFDEGRLSKNELASSNKMISVVKNLIGDVAPSLLHGDLWSGNYLISVDGDPFLIDPSVYYGHNEVDLAMTRLFGGFTTHFYQAYHEILPAHPNQKELVDIYQLYYLLVHLNLFGSFYRNSVVQLLKKYFL